MDNSKFGGLKVERKIPGEDALGTA